MNRRKFLGNSWKFLLPVHALSYAVQKNALAAITKGAKSFFAAPEIDTLNSYFDTLIPRSKNGPSAAEAGVVTYVGKWVADELPRWRRLKGMPVELGARGRFYRYLVKRLDLISHEKYKQPFSKLSAEQRTERVSQMASSPVKQVGYAIASVTVDEGAVMSNSFESHAVIASKDTSPTRSMAGTQTTGRGSPSSIFVISTTRRKMKPARTAGVD